jgi:alpha-beta hydrolase superfamily lysophospholipase
MHARRFTIAAAAMVATLVLPAAADAAPKPTKPAKVKSVPGAPGVRLGPSGSDFYTPPARLPKGGHGTLIWARPIRAPQSARAWKVLYRSELLNGKAVAVSGFVVAPKGRAPAGGRPVLAWAHGTEGLARNCAPSLAPNPARDLVDYFTYRSRFQQDVGVPGLSEMLQAGYVVAATDYQGLGAGSNPEYAIPASQSQNVFDSVFAARGLKAARAGKRVVALGWSQGGGAALWAGESAEYGAPLRLLGAATLAPESDTGPQAAGLVAPGPVTPTSPAHAAAIRMNLYGGFANAYRELDPADVVSPAGMGAFACAAAQCVNHLGYVINTNVTDLAALFQPTVPADWQQRFDENTPGMTATSAPLLVMQGTADTVINPNATAQYVQRACGFGQPIEFTTYDGATHQTIPYVAEDEYLSWIADRFAGRPAPSNCPPAG